MKPLYPPLPDDLVTFNVRGRIFQTTLTTLRRFPDSVIYKMVEYEQHRNRRASSESPNNVSPTNDTFFIDRDPDLFAAILHYHDTEQYIGEGLPSTSKISKVGPSTVTPKSLLLEAQYYNIESLEQDITVDQSLERDLAVKYEYYCCYINISPYLYQPVMVQVVHEEGIPVSEEGAASYRIKERGLDGLVWAKPDIIRKIAEVLKQKNTNTEGYHWTIFATMCKDENTMGVIFKGEKN